MTRPIDINAPAVAESGDVLTPDVLRFLADLHNEFNQRRLDLLAARRTRQKSLDAGEQPDFLPSTAAVRSGSWSVGPTPPDLYDRRVEITGPTDAKMVINALNSGAKVFMADFEDANSPTWANMIQGQANLSRAIDRTLTFTSPEGKSYQLNENPAVLMVRPRGWHLDERHATVGGQPISGSLFDFGLYFFRNAKRLRDRGSGPYVYLPKLENHLEARLWNDVFVFAQQRLGLPIGTIKCTVLIETILAAYEMDEILYELRDHIVGLNAGRWDYIFSIIKKFGRRPECLLPDRAQVTMTVPFMRAYTQLLVHTCHKRGAHAMGGMAAFIPNRRDAKVNETAIAKVREDKQREADDGFDGTWVAHPDLVPIALQEFDAAFGRRRNQRTRTPGAQAVGWAPPTTSPSNMESTPIDPKAIAAQLRNVHIENGTISETGIRSNLSVAIQYLASWLNGLGAVAINNLMEDAATAEIARAQVWQWLHHSSAGGHEAGANQGSHPGAKLDDGRRLDAALYRSLLEDELERIKQMVGPVAFDSGRYSTACDLVDSLVRHDAFADFLTIPAYAHLP